MLFWNRYRDKLCRISVDDVAQIVKTQIPSATGIPKAPHLRTMSEVALSFFPTFMTRAMNC